MTVLSNPTVVDELLAVLDARGIGVKVMAREMRSGTKPIYRLLHGEEVPQVTMDRVRKWIEAQPEPEPEDTSEEWRPIPGYGGYYEASSRGRIRSVPRTVEHPTSGTNRYRGRTLRQAPHRSGHLWVELCGPAGKKTRQVHQLVLEAFVGPKPPGMVGCHWDGNPANNRIENLRWDTQSANLFDAMRHGTHPTLARQRKLAALQIQENRGLE